MTRTTSTELEYLQERKRLLERQIELQEGLPYKYGWPWYEWAKDFTESKNKIRLLCAANQISKSSTHIRNCIDWAIDKEKWPFLWRTRPQQFWYLYPTKEVASIEVEEKWKPEFLPNGKFKDDPVYGWREEWQNKHIFAIYFNSGVSVYFKTYAQDVAHLQTGTCSAIFADEELPEELYDELQFRLAATNGYFSMVFTATMGQEIWRRAMEEIGTPDELFVGAWKKQISMYDCQEYVDGTKSQWTDERIAEVVAKCKSEAEVLRRVYGRFVVSEGLKYAGFEKKRNFKKFGPVPRTWNTYTGVDIGAGGASNHPSAIAFVAVDPDCRKGVVYRGWRGDKQVTAASDVLAKYVEIRGDVRPVLQCYDFAAVDFKTYADRMGESFTTAEKNHLMGEDLLNTLFKTGMLVIDESDPELHKLVVELSTLRVDSNKKRARDDFIDALRYAVTRIPWDFTVNRGDHPESYTEPEPNLPEYVKRRNDVLEAMSKTEEYQQVNEEIEEWNELYG